MTLATPALPLYSPQLFLALRRVSRGRIGATALDGTLVARNEDLAPGIFAALFTLQQEGFVKLAPAVAAEPGWFPAVLTLRGTQLLSSWSLRHSRPAAPMLAVSRG